MRNLGNSLELPLKGKVTEIVSKLGQNLYCSDSAFQ